MFGRPTECGGARFGRFIISWVYSGATLLHILLAMPHCIRCRIEYQDGFQRCAECGDSLHNGAPLSEPPREVEWVRLASLQHDAEGEMLQEVLEKSGISTMLKRDVFASAFGSQGTSLFVDASQLERAREIQEEIIGR